MRIIIIHMASCLVDIQQIPAVWLQPSNVSIHRPVRVNVKRKELTCYGGRDEQVIRNKMQQALVNMGKTLILKLNDSTTGILKSFELCISGTVTKNKLIKAQFFSQL